MTFSAARFVRIRGADNNTVCIGNFPLCPICRIAAHNADCECLCNIFRYRKQLRYVSILVVLAVGFRLLAGLQLL